MVGWIGRIGRIRPGSGVGSIGASWCWAVDGLGLDLTLVRPRLLSRWRMRHTHGGAHRGCVSYQPYQSRPSLQLHRHEPQDHAPPALGSMRNSSLPTLRAHMHQSVRIMPQCPTHLLDHGLLLVRRQFLRHAVLPCLLICGTRSNIKRDEVS